jgi:hypothetical protein
MSKLIEMPKEEFENLCKTAPDVKGVPVYFCRFDDGIRSWPHPDDRVMRFEVFVEVAN